MVKRGGRTLSIARLAVRDRPFLTRTADRNATKGGNVTRLQVYGAPEIRAAHRRRHLDAVGASAVAQRR